MKVFILGLSQCGRTTVAKALASAPDALYISSDFWVKTAFENTGSLPEDPEEYDREFTEYLTGGLKKNHNLITDGVETNISMHHEYSHKNKYIIDGISSPRDFMKLFDYNEDVAIFLNRTDNPSETTDHDGIGQNVIRDYCLWLATMGLLPKDRWTEYNYRMPGEESEFVKELSSRNLVTITKNINKAIEIMRARLWKIET
jgi:adenylate kinase family enzyme